MTLFLKKSFFVTFYLSGPPIYIVGDPCPKETIGMTVSVTLCWTGNYTDSNPHPMTAGIDCSHSVKLKYE